MDNIIVMLKPLDSHICSVDGGIVILEDTPPGRKEMLQHGGEDVHSVPLSSDWH